MKILLLLLALAIPTVAQESEAVRNASVVRTKTIEKDGKLSMKVSIRLSEASLDITCMRFNEEGQAVQGRETLKAASRDAERLIAALKKYLEWAEVAKTNNVESLSKPLGSFFIDENPRRFLGDLSFSWDKERAVASLSPGYFQETHVAAILAFYAEVSKELADELKARRELLAAQDKLFK